MLILPSVIMLVVFCEPPLPKHKKIDTVGNAADVVIRNRDTSTHNTPSTVATVLGSTRLGCVFLGLFSRLIEDYNLD